jgi:hypothetical protein
METIGEKFSVILTEIEETLWEFELYKGEKPTYTEDGFRAACKIFMSVIMDKIWELQVSEKIPMEDRIKMVEKCGADLRSFVKMYTNIDTFELYKKK